jgi:murein DD-endopeptidase MepM/ murein hydrolase activator NlpD
VLNLVENSSRVLARAWAVVLCTGVLAPVPAWAQAQLATSSEAELDLAGLASQPAPRIVVGPEGLVGDTLRYPVRAEVGPAVVVAFSASRPSPPREGEASAAALPTQAPVSGRLTSRFGARVHPISGGWRPHAGIDLAAPTGSPVVATSDGVVSAAGWAGGYGLRVALAHGGGLETRYAHLSQLAVRQGQRVTKGQLIGLVGSTGRSTGPHVHYELRQNGQAIDPLAH